MSTWTNEFDVFRDLDRLSGFRHNNVTYPALNAFGRGKLIVKEDENGRRTKVAQFLPPPKIPVAQSYPEVEVTNNMPDDSTWDRDRDLYMQLREVCGRGYSNELIEEEFGHTGWHSQEQLNDVSSVPIVEDLLEDERNNLIIPDSEHTASTVNESSSPQLPASDPKLVLPDVKHSQTRLFVHPPKLKPSRNALLNSLARKKILQLSEEPEMTGPPITCCERRTGCVTEDAISIDKSLPDTKLSQTALFSGHSHSATGDELTAPNVDSQKMHIESVEICDQTQSYGEVQKQSINWSDIRKLKAAGYSPVSKRSHGSLNSPVCPVDSYTSQKSRQDSKIRSVAATDILDLPGLSVSANSLCKEGDTSESEDDDHKKQDISHRASSVQSVSKTKRTKDHRSSLPSSPTNSITSTKKLSWTSLRQHNSHPKNIMLSDYIESVCSLGSGPTQNFSEVSASCPEELSNCNSLQIHSEKDFPPLD